ncbi:hypothetical protein H1R20_g4882, partial [Candolleomyces eurysporus]
MKTVLGSRRVVRFLVPIATLILIFWLLPLPSYLEEKENNDSGTFDDYVKPTEPKSVAPTSSKVITEVVAEKPTPSPTPLGKHKYRPDGLLEVDFDGPHPIYELIAAAEERWKKKVDRASKTLEEAVEEYKRRYKRAPPKGFDLWWQYVIEHKVQLPDEYDQIHHDLEPFWGVAPADLLKTQEELEKKKDSYTLGKNEKGEIAVLAWAFEDGRYDQYIRSSESVIALLREIEAWLPPFRATFSPHDGPNRMSDYAIKSAVLEAAASQTYLERKALPKIAGNGWMYSCPPDSPARQHPVDLKKPPALQDKKTFIYDHVKSMDPCQHTNHFLIHGQLLGLRTGPTPQAYMVPEFSHCSTTMHHNIRMPTPYGFVEEVLPRSDDPPFDEKVDDRLLWRGRNTGIFHGRDTLWQNAHRDYFVRLANEIEGTVDILSANVSQAERVGSPRRFRKSRINPATMDVAFAQEPIMCAPEVCDILESMYQFMPFQSGKESGKYKYVIDVDGNGWSGRFKKLMTTNSLIFKSTIYPEWYHDRVEPWVHYVPVQMDLSDLHDALVFFRGDGNGDGAHEDLGAKIAAASREWSRTFWRREDLVAYFFRLMLEFSRLMSLDREAMSFTLPEEGD